MMEEAGTETLRGMLEQDLKAQEIKMQQPIWMTRLEAKEARHPVEISKTIRKGQVKPAKKAEASKRLLS
jgi:hypothetical protein